MMVVIRGWVDKAHERASTSCCPLNNATNQSCKAALTHQIEPREAGLVPEDPVVCVCWNEAAGKQVLSKRLPKGVGRSLGELLQESTGVGAGLSITRSGVQEMGVPWRRSNSVQGGCVVACFLFSKKST